MTKNKHDLLRMSIAILSAWSGLMIILYALITVDWFHLGDFSFRTAMAYHGILIPAWMMLVLACFRHNEHSNFIRTLLGTGAVTAGILTGIGSALIHDQGLYGFQRPRSFNITQQYGWLCWLMPAVRWQKRKYQKNVICFIGIIIRS